MSQTQYDLLMSNLLKEKHALTKLRAEMEGRQEKLCYRCKKFGHLARNMVDQCLVYLVYPLPIGNESVRYPLTGKTVPGVPGVVPTSIHTLHIKRIPNISHYHHQAVFVQPIQHQNSTTDFRLTFRQWIAGLTYSL